jgi:transcriptional regulator GlxA family with amidase domain
LNRFSSASGYDVTKNPHISGKLISLLLFLAFMERFSFPKHLPLTAVFVIPPQVHLLDISGPAHIFYEATDYGASINLKFVSVYSDVSEETSTSGLSFAKLESFESIQLKSGDVIFLPGIKSTYLTDAKFFNSIQPFFKWLNIQHSNNVRICSVCTGAFLLAESGLINGKQATTHWKFQDLLKDCYPSIEVLTNRLFVLKEHIYTSAGVASGIDLALYVLEEIYGTRFSATIAREVVIYLRRSQEDPQLSILLQYRNHLEDRIHIVQEWLSSHLDRKHTIDQLADLIHTSERNLTRLFKDTTGITIGQYVEKLRVEHALHLLRDKQKMTEVAKACGLQSTNQLRALLKKHVGKPEILS